MTAFRQALVLALALGSTATASRAQVGPPVSPGFPNVPQTPGALLSGLNAPEQGRTAIIAYHGGVLFTVPEVPSSQPGADFLVRTWDISDPAAPRVTAVLERTPMPVNAHGYMKSGEYLVLGPNWPPEAPWSWRYRAPGDLERRAYPDLLAIGVRGMLFPPWFVGETWWSYGDIEGNAFIERDWNRLSEWDHLGLTGVIGHPFLIGDLLIFASDQSRTGVATYDVSDPSDPVLLDVLTAGGPGGYWPELWGGDGRLLVVWPYRTNGNGIRVVDATDPTDLRFVADTPLPGDAAMYLQFQDERAFVGDHVVDMRSFESILHLDAANATRTNDGGTGIDTSQFALPLGNLLVTGGIGPDEGMAIWAHQAEPDTRGPEVGYHRPLAGQTGVSLEMPISLLIHETLETFTIVNGETFIVRPLGGDPLPGQLHFAFDDVLTFQPDADLLPDTTYEVVIPEGGIKDAAGNGIVGYSFTFSTGGSVGGNRPPVVEQLSADRHPSPPGGSLGLSAAASDPDSDPLEYRFDFGDGSPRTAWSSASSASHAYATAGHYQASVQVRDPSGSVAGGTTTVTVAPAPPPSWRRPRQSSPILVDESARRVWAVNPDNDSLSALDVDRLELVVEVATCDDPRSVALDSAGGELWVACHDDDRIRIHSAADGAPVETLELGYGSAPAGLVIEDGGSEAHVTLQGRGELARFDVPSRSETARLSLGPRPRALALTNDRRLLVTRLLAEKDHATVWEVDAASYTLTRTHRMLKFGGEANRDTTASGKGVANLLSSVDASWDNARAWFAGNKPNSERGPLTGPDLDQDNSVRNLVAGLDLGAGGLAGQVDLDNSDSASAVAYTPLGDYLFVALQGNDEVLVLDALRLDSASGLGALVTRLGVGAAPQGIAFDRVTGRSFVKNLTGRSITVLETDELFRTGARQVDSVEVPTVSAETMDPQVLLGKSVFYRAGDPRMSSEGYISCASCHLDGGHDARTWDFTGRGEGLRNTTSLRGRAGLAHGNVHWSANFDEIQDFENDIRLAFGGSGFLDEADWLASRDPLGAPKAGRSPELDALAAYLGSLGVESLPRSPHRGSDGFLTPQGLAGREVFAAEGCGDCHAGPAFTDSTLGAPTLRDVGTIRTTSGGRLGEALTGLDTPTLLGIWNTAPYLHDGSAATLAQVFALAGGTLYPAESGSVADGAGITDQWVDLNNDSTPRGEAYVGLNGGRLALPNVDGGSGGPGAVEVRHSNGWPADLDLVVNGTVVESRSLPPVGNEPQWRQTVWEVARFEGVDLLPGAVNTIELVGTAGVDDVTVSTADELARAEPHRRVLALDAADRDALLAYLLQLDGRPEEQVAEPPGPVDLRVDAGELSWAAVPGAEGYDVVAGSLATLRDGGGDFAAAAESCLADDLAATSLAHDAAPVGSWFLARAVAGAGPGPWDSAGAALGASREPGLASAPAACP